MSGPSSENEIRVKLTADHGELDSGMDASAEKVKTDSAAMQDAVTKAGDGMSAAAKAIGESAEEASARIRAMVQESGRQQEAMTATARASSESAAATEAFAAANGRAARSVAETVAAQNAQMIQMSEFMGAEAAAATAAEAATVATNEQTAATGRLGVMSGAVARELGVLAGEAARGNWTRLEGSTITLANRMDLLQYAFSATGLAAIGAGALVYGFGKAIYDGEQESAQFNKTVIATGGFLGVTQGQFDGMAASLVTLEVTSGQSREALMRFAESGRFSGDQLQQAGQMAADMATVTGQSMDKCVEAIVKLQENPVKAVQQLDEQYHFLTLTQLDEIEQLEKQGDAQGAAAEAMKLYADTMHERAAQVEDNLGSLDRLMKTVREDASFMWDAISGIGRKSTLQSQYDDVLKEYTAYQDQIANAQAMGSKGGPGTMMQVAIDKSEELRARLNQLRQEMQGENAQAQAEAERQRTQQEGKDAARKYDSDFGGLDRQQLRLQKTIELENELAAIHKANPDDQRVQGIEFDPMSGAVVGGERMVGLLAEIDKKYQDIDTTTRSQRQAAAAERAAERAAAKEAKEEASGEMNQLAQKRAQTQQYSQDRLQLDQQIVDRAKALYGEDSSHYTAALRQKETDTREFNNRLREINVQQLADKRTEQTSEIAEQRRAAEEQYREGQITAQQLLTLERNLITQKLAIDLQYLQAKRALDASDALAQAKDDAAILKAKEEANRDLAKSDKEYHDNAKREWETTARQMSSSFTGAVRGMLFQGQTLKGGVLNIAESIGSTMISVAIEKPLERWVLAEAEKLHIGIQTQTSLAAAEQSQRIANSVAEATTNVQSVTRAAGVAAAQGTASFAGAPWPIDMGAPAFGAEMMAAALSYAPMASAAGGWGQVPADQIAQIHKDEMVLPAHIADFVRSGAASAQGASAANGSGSTVHHHHWNISTMDSRSFEGFLRRGGGAVAARYASGVTKNAAATRS